MLDEDAKRRLHTNPLRILDTKNPALQDIVRRGAEADRLPRRRIADAFRGRAGVLRDAGIPFAINPRLVRGLDYYNLTVFEWVTDRLGAQGTVCAGGRYDGLVEQLGGKPAPACGFAMGIERLLALMAAMQGGAPDARRRMSISCIRAKPRWRLAFRVAEAPARCRAFAVHAALRRRQLQVADEEGRCIGRAVGGDHRRRRGGGRGSVS